MNKRLRVRQSLVGGTIQGILPSFDFRYFGGRCFQDRVVRARNNVGRARTSSYACVNWIRFGLACESFRLARWVLPLQSSIVRLVEFFFIGHETAFFQADANKITRSAKRIVKPSKFGIRRRLVFHGLHKKFI
jgi:hypothetical protein